jgi:hypothetical protein
MVDITIKRHPRPDPALLPTRSADGSVRLVSCPTCGKTRVIDREAIMSGAWVTYPSCMKEDRS